MTSTERYNKRETERRRNKLAFKAFREAVEKVELDVIKRNSNRDLLKEYATKIDGE